MSDWMGFAAGLGIGVYLGWGYRRLWAVLRHNLGRGEPEPAAPLPPIRLVSVHAVTSPARIETEGHREAWDRAITDVAFWGDILGWSERRMLSEGVASRRSIRAYRGFLADHKLLVVTERGATCWVRGWDRHRLRVSIYRRLLSLPYPEHEPWPLRMAWRSAQMAQRSAAGADGAEVEQ